MHVYVCASVCVCARACVCWNCHFAKVLNVVSEFSDELELVRQRDVMESLGDLALGKIRSDKAAENSGILPEMLKVEVHVAGFVSMLTDLVHAVWEEQKVPQEWENATLNLIPKRGNLHLEGNNLT